MGVLKALAEELVKMFAADIWLSLAAVAAVVAGAVVRAAGIVAPGALPFMIAAAILAALAVGVFRRASP